MGLLLDVISGKETPYTPVWLMRQAGRYMPEYRAVREKNTFLDMCYKAELACEVTMQPIDILDVDAAILFSDILPPLIPMGFNLEYVKGVGPVIHNPLRSAKDLDQLNFNPDAKFFTYIQEAVSMIRAKLPKGKDLIGFAGAPFTMASYAIEGGGSKTYQHIKTLMYREPDTYHKLMTLITGVTKIYLKMQLDAGAQMVQLFDSWGGALSRSDYMRYAHPYTKEIISWLKKETGKPVIHFVKGAGSWFDVAADSEADVCGVDWTLDLDLAAKMCGNSKVLQGSLDPISLFAPQDVLDAKLQEVLTQAKGIKGHIFNLGHGIIPHTPVENVKFVVKRVQELTRR
ncbi:MAG: uroporphyrinogen decarboxylase [Lentisphaeraceae bacterium]|nr:uroporphyrinogen decarboxylase [Lentisphaeraceae bacterium]